MSDSTVDVRFRLYGRDASDYVVLSDLSDVYEIVREYVRMHRSAQNVPVPFVVSETPEIVRKTRVWTTRRVTCTNVQCVRPAVFVAEDGFGCNEHRSEVRTGFAVTA